MPHEVVSFAQTTADSGSWPEAAQKFAADRGINKSIIEREGWVYASSSGAFQAVKHKKKGILIPIRTFQGETSEHLLRVLEDNSSGPKYLLKKGTANRLMVPARTNPLIAQSKRIRLYICESIVKAVALNEHMDNKQEYAVGINGVNGAFRERKLIKDIRELALEGRIVTIVFDSDWGDEEKWQVRAATINTADALAKLGAVVRIMLLPVLKGTDKVGIDDFLVHKDGGFKAFRQLEAEALTPEDSFFDPWRMPPIVDELNKKHAVTIVGASTVVAHIKEVPGEQRKIVFQKEKDFISRYRGTRIVTGTRDDGSTIEKDAGTVWLESPHRRQYEEVILDPKLPPGGNDVEKTYNMWAGFKYDVPVPPKASWKLFKKLIVESICDNDEELAVWLLTWMARCIQKPWERARVAVVLQGDEGIGKGVFANVFGALFGVHYTAISQQVHATGRFNAFQKESLLVFCDEAFFAGDPRIKGPLMAMITEPTMRIEPKNIDSFEVPNLRSFIFASNEDMVVPASLSARRWAVFKVSNAHQQDKAYFDALMKEMDAGGYAALLEDLRNLELDGKTDPYTAPITKGLSQQKLLSLKPAQQFWVDCIQKGEYPASLIASSSTVSAVGWAPWPEDRIVEIHCPAANLAYLEMLQLHKAHSHEFRSHATTLGMGLRDLLGDIKKVDKKIGGKKFHVWIGPHLGAAEELLSEKLGISRNTQQVLVRKKRFKVGLGRVR
jgi:hypothetical protein